MTMINSKKNILKNKIKVLEKNIDKDLGKLYILKQEYAKYKISGYGKSIYYRQRLTNRLR